MHQRNYLLASRVGPVGKRIQHGNDKELLVLMAPVIASPESMKVDWGLI